MPKRPYPPMKPFSVIETDKLESPGTADVSVPKPAWKPTSKTDFSSAFNAFLKHGESPGLMQEFVPKRSRNARSLDPRSKTQAIIPIARVASHSESVLARMTDSPDAYLERVAKALTAHHLKKETILNNQRKAKEEEKEVAKQIKELQKLEDKRQMDLKMIRVAQIRMGADRRLGKDLKRQNDQLANVNPIERVSTPVPAAMPSLQEMAAMQPTELYKLFHSSHYSNPVAEAASTEPEMIPHQDIVAKKSNHRQFLVLRQLETSSLNKNQHPTPCETKNCKPLMMAETETIRNENHVMTMIKIKKPFPIVNQNH